MEDKWLCPLFQKAEHFHRVVNLLLLKRRCYMWSTFYYVLYHIQWRKKVTDCDFCCSHIKNFFKFSFDHFFRIYVNETALIYSTFTSKKIYICNNFKKWAFMLKNETNISFDSKFIFGYDLWHTVMFKSVMCLESISVPVNWSNNMICPNSC